MSHQHYAGCHLHHMACAQIEIRRLQAEVQRLRTPSNESGGTWCQDVVGFDCFAEEKFVLSDHQPPPSSERIPGGASWTVPAVDEPPVSLDPSPHP